MPLVRDTIAHFIKAEGHKVDIAAIDDESGVSEILFRTRGQVFSITTYEKAPGSFTISTAYEIPDWAREAHGNLETLTHVGDDYPDVAFAMAHDGGLFIASCDEEHDSPESFTRTLWETVARVREAGSHAIERIVDRTESKAAAEKFINSFMRGER
jgi:hypothetical protein